LISQVKGWLTVKKLLVLTIVAGVLGLSGLGCGKETSKPTGSTGAKPADTGKTSGDTKH
jgi:hypothetical protein